jgi:hypothetical protein
MKGGFGQNMLSFFHALRQASESAIAAPQRKKLYLDCLRVLRAEMFAALAVKK